MEVDPRLAWKELDVKVVAMPWYSYAPTMVVLGISVEAGVWDGWWVDVMKTPWCC